MNSARGKDVIERVTSGMDWAKGTWAKNAKAKKVKGGDDTDRGEGVLLASKEVYALNLILICNSLKRTVYFKRLLPSLQKTCNRSLTLHFKR